MEEKNTLLYAVLLLIAAFTIAILSHGGIFSKPVYAPYDHYVTFNMTAESLAPNFAYDLASRGEPGNNPWVYNVYLFGMDSNGMDGRIAVYGYSSGGWIPASPVSPPLKPGRDYTIIWRYNSTHGGELIIDGISQGSATGGGSLDTSFSSSFHLGEDMLQSPPGPARAHSAFNGRMWDGSHYEKDMNLYEEGLSYPPIVPETGK